MPLTQVQGGMILASGQSIPKAALPTGSVLQVVQAYKTDVFTTTASVDTDITGLTVTLTPTSSTSKFLITSFISGFSNNGVGGGFCIQRNGTKIGLADASGSRTRTSYAGDLYTGDAAGTIQMQFNSVACFLDSPSTSSSITYKVTAQCNGGALYINREEQDSDNNDATRCVSNITVMEIAA
jgi:hypothetical protein